MILPTICLLWFMNRALRNERLAVRQRWTDLYSRPLDRMGQRLDELWIERIRRLDAEMSRGLQPAELFERVTRRDSDWGFCAAIAVFDARGKLLYPLRDPLALSGDAPEAFAGARRLEFNQDYVAAAGLYATLAENALDESARVTARLGQIRSLRKSGDLDAALTLCRDLAYGPGAVVHNAAALSLVSRARLLLIDLQRDRLGQARPQDWQELIDSVTDYGAAVVSEGDARPAMPSGTRLFLLRKALEAIRSGEVPSAPASDAARMEQLLAAETLAAAFLERYPGDAEARTWTEEESIKLVSLLRLALTKLETGPWEWAEQLRQQLSAVLNVAEVGPEALTRFERPSTPFWLDQRPNHAFQRLDLEETCYGMVHRTPTHVYLVLARPEHLARDIDRFSADLLDWGLFYRVTEAGSRVIEGLGRQDLGQVAEAQTALAKVSLGVFFPSWTMEVFCEDLTRFDRAAEEQMALTLWIGVLAIAVIIACGGLAARVVGNQIRTNKLKNDFIATVTHELKTPLTSMRLQGIPCWRTRPEIATRPWTTSS